MGKSVYDIAAVLDIMLAKGRHSSLMQCVKSDAGLAVGIGGDLKITKLPWLLLQEDEDKRLFGQAVSLLSDVTVRKDIKIDGHWDMAQAEYHGGESLRLSLEPNDCLQPSVTW